MHNATDLNSKKARIRTMHLCDTCVYANWISNVIWKPFLGQIIRHDKSFCSLLNIETKGVTECTAYKNNERQTHENPIQETHP